MSEDDNSWSVSLSSSCPNSCHFAAPPGWQIQTRSTALAFYQYNSSNVDGYKETGHEEWRSPKGGQELGSRIAINLRCREERKELFPGSSEMTSWKMAACKRQETAEWCEKSWDAAENALLSVTFSTVTMLAVRSWWSGDTYAWMAAHTSMCWPGGNNDCCLVDIRPSDPPSLRAAASLLCGKSSDLWCLLRWMMQRWC